MIAGTASLRDIPLFETSTERSLKVIAGIAEEATFPAGAVVIREGDEGDSLIVIRGGPRWSTKVDANSVALVAATSLGRSPSSTAAPARRRSLQSSRSKR